MRVKPNTLRNRGGQGSRSGGNVDYPEVSYLDEFLAAMKQWGTPAHDDSAKRDRVEMTLKDVLCDERTVTSSELADWDDDEMGTGVALTCWVGDNDERVMFVYDTTDEDTGLWWVQGGLLGRVDQCLLRIEDGDPLGLATLLGSIRQARHSENDLW